MTRLSIVLVCIMAIPLVVAAQGPTVDIVTSVASVEKLSLSDIDYINATAPKWLFSIQVRVLGAATTDISEMRITLDATLASGESFPNASTYVTVPFTVQGTRTFTNIDLMDKSLQKDYDFDNAAKQRFEETALPSGFVPAGVYRFRVAVTVARTQQTTTADFRFVLTNPSLVDLISPADRETSPTQFPLFQWKFDGVLSRLSVYEMLPGQTSLEEAASGVPHLVTELPGTTFLYPSSGVRSLEQGKTYVWFVEGAFATSGGTSYSLKSPLRSFSIASNPNQVLLGMLRDLEDALGPKYRSLFDQIREEGLSPTGQLRINGANVTPADVLRLIGQFRRSPASVQAAELE